METNSVVLCIRLPFLFFCRLYDVSMVCRPIGCFVYFQILTYQAFELYPARRCYSSSHYQWIDRLHFVLGAVPFWGFV